MSVKLETPDDEETTEVLAVGNVRASFLFFLF